MTIAATILAQLGGNQFIAMTGAKNFVRLDSGLQFDMPRGATNKATRCTVTLQANDTYAVAFFRWSARKLEMAFISNHRDTYADRLQELFTRETGMTTSL